MLQLDALRGTSWHRQRLLLQFIIDRSQQTQVSYLEGAFSSQLHDLLLAELGNQRSEELSEGHIAILVDVQQFEVVLGISTIPELIALCHD